MSARLRLCVALTLLEGCAHPTPERPSAAVAVDDCHGVPNASVIVEIAGVRDGRGQLLVSLYREREGFPDDPRAAAAKARETARPGTVEVVFEQLGPGPFAVAVHHDENGDFKMATGLFGMPTEGYGFSRDASAPFGPPSFDAAHLTLHAGEHQRIRVNLHY